MTAEDILPDGATSEINKPLVKCLPGWYAFGNKCYRGFGKDASNRRTWKKAFEKCAEFGGNLASIHSNEEQEFLKIFILSELESPSWIGLNDHKEESVFEWSDGSEVSLFYWDEHEPNSNNNQDRNEDCVLMRHELFASLGKWHDYTCDKQLPYICQTLQDNRQFEPNPIFCESYGYSYRGSCFIPIKRELTWEKAEKYCHQNFEDGHLITINDIDVKEFIDYVLSDDLGKQWIGINITDTKSLKWTSGWFVSYSNWEDQAPVGGLLKCAGRLQSGHWEARRCNEKLPFICEKSSSKNKPRMLPNKANLEGYNCPDGNWIDMGGDRCYLFETEQKFSWNDANFECLRKGGSMLSFHSMEDMHMINQFLKFSDRIQINFFKLHIGLYRGVDNVFRWTDGSNFDFQNWANGEPNNANNVEFCGEINFFFNAELNWNDNDCKPAGGYVCFVYKGSPDKSSAKNIGNGPLIPQCRISLDNGTNGAMNPQYQNGFSASLFIGVLLAVLSLTVIVAFLYLPIRRKKEARNISKENIF